MLLRASWLTVACAAIECGGTGGNGTTAQKEQPAFQTDEQKAPDEKTQGDKTSTPVSLPLSSSRFEASPDAEMFKGLIPPRTKPTDEDGGLEDTPQDRAGLLKSARRALKAGDVGYALAIIDVLNLMHPEDPEILELRGDALMEQGLKEDAMADLDKCCSLGRSTCCR
jgi:hypothetical protein